MYDYFLSIICRFANYFRFFNTTSTYVPIKKITEFAIVELITELD